MFGNQPLLHHTACRRLEKPLAFQRLLLAVKPLNVCQNQRPTVPSRSYVATSMLGHSPLQIAGHTGVRLAVTHALQNIDGKAHDQSALTAYLPIHQTVEPTTSRTGA